MALETKKRSKLVMLCCMPGVLVVGFAFLILTGIADVVSIISGKKSKERHY